MAHDRQLPTATSNPASNCRKYVTVRVDEGGSRARRRFTTCCLRRKITKQMGKPWPLLLFLHGLGECGNNELERVKIHGPPKLVESRPDFPFVLVTPQFPPPTGRHEGCAKSVEAGAADPARRSRHDQSEHRPDARLRHWTEHGRVRHVATRGRVSGALRGRRADLRRRRASSEWLRRYAACRSGRFTARATLSCRSPKARKWSMRFAAPAATCDSPCIPTSSTTHGRKRTTTRSVRVAAVAPRAAGR